MRKLLLAAMAAAALVCPRAASAQAIGGNITGTTCAAGDSGIGCVSTTLTQLGQVSVDVSGTFSATLQFEATINSTSWFGVNAYPIGSRIGPVQSTTTTGQWRVHSAGYKRVRVRASAYVSGTAVVVFSAGGGAGSHSIAVAATNTIATAPVDGTLTAATCTQVYAGSASACQVSVTNHDAAIKMTCGQTSACTATKGLGVPSGATYSTSWGYGGAVYCFPASGTPAYGVQVTVCP